MHQVKLFRGIENELPQLEAEVNAWLAEQPDLEVVRIHASLSPQSPVGENSAHSLTHSNFAPSDALVMVHYQK